MSTEGTIMFENEREVKMIEFDIDMDLELRTKLLEIARVEILNDEDALLNWMVNKALREYCEKADKNETMD